MLSEHSGIMALFVGGSQKACLFAMLLPLCKRMMTGYSSRQFSLFKDRLEKTSRKASSIIPLEQILKRVCFLFFSIGHGSDDHREFL